MAEKPFALPNKEMGYLWDRGNPQPIIIFSLMATTLRKSNNAPGSSLISNASKTNMNTWADRVEEFSSNVNENNAFSSDYGLRFFIIKRTEYDFTKVSLFFNTKSY